MSQESVIGSAVAAATASTTTPFNDKAQDQSVVTAGDAAASINEIAAANQEKEQKSVEKKLNDAEPLSREQMEQMADHLQEFMSKLNKSLEFSVHEDSGKDVIKVKHRDSGDILRQYPSEEVLDLMSRLADSMGLLLDTKV